jgi:hypothetical protein
LAEKPVPTLGTGVGAEEAELFVKVNGPDALSAKPGYVTYLKKLFVVRLAVRRSSIAARTACRRIARYR